MKKNKRIIVVLAAVCMMIATCSIAFAAETHPERIMITVSTLETGLVVMDLFV